MTRITATPCVLLLVVLLEFTGCRVGEVSHEEMQERDYKFTRELTYDNVREEFSAFFKETGRLPDTLTELHSLPSAESMNPTDNYNNNQWMVYTHTCADCATIYSIGPDRKDNGGVLFYDDSQRGRPTAGDLVIMLQVVHKPDGKNSLLFGWAQNAYQQLPSDKQGKDRE